METHLLAQEHGIKEVQALDTQRGRQSLCPLSNEKSTYGREVEEIRAKFGVCLNTDLRVWGVILGCSEGLFSDWECRKQKNTGKCAK